MSTQLAVRLTDEQLSMLDLYVVHIGADSRAEGLRSALETVAAMVRQAAIDRAYAAAYSSFPETEEEAAEVYRMSIESIEEEPWEKWW